MLRFAIIKQQLIPDSFGEGTSKITGNRQKIDYIVLISAS